MAVPTIEVAEVQREITAWNEPDFGAAKMLHDTKITDSHLIAHIVACVCVGDAG